MKNIFKAALSAALVVRNRVALSTLKDLGGQRQPLWAHQDSLPELPLPKPEVTINRWLQSIQPFINAEQAAEATSAAQEFLQTDAAELQKVLVERAKASSNGNWLEDFWLEFAYLRGRESLVTNVSYFTTDSTDNMVKAPLVSDPCRRLSQLISSTIDFKIRVETGTLQCQLVGGKVPVCMNMFKQVLFTSQFGTLF